MSILGKIIEKGISTAATKSIIKTVGNTTVGVISATAQKQSQKDDAVDKNGKLYIKPTRTSENYIGESVDEIVQELLGIGFESITLKPINKLNERSIKKYGKIKSIAINGNHEFFRSKRVPATSHIVIEFLDFREDVSPEVFTKVKRLSTGKIKNADELEYSYQSTPSVYHALKSFCPFCGEKVIYTNARFCASCGKNLYD